MSETGVPRCHKCALRAKAEANPQAFLGRLWFWHIKWCPGWKTYQEYLTQQDG